MYNALNTFIALLIFYSGAMGRTFHCNYFTLKSNRMLEKDNQHLQIEQKFSMILEQN